MRPEKVIVRLLHRPSASAARLLTPMCLLAASAAARAGLTPAQIADTARPAVVFISADTPAGESVGSGFIVDPLGTVVTNLHVVEGATAIRVKLASGLAYDHVRIRAVDGRADLAILQLAGFGLPNVPLGDSDSVRRGDRVVLLASRSTMRDDSSRLRRLPRSRLGPRARAAGGHS